LASHWHLILSCRQLFAGKLSGAPLDTSLTETHRNWSQFPTCAAVRCFAYWSDWVKTRLLHGAT